MSRTRVISAAEALYASEAPATGTGLSVVQLHRVQSVSYDFQINRTPVNQFGQLAPLSREITETPTVNLNFSYLFTNVLNETNLGFVTDGSTSAIANLLDKTEDERNYFILTVPEGNDAAGYTGDSKTVIGIGNGFLTSYSLEGSVGGFATTTVGVQGLNMVGYAAATGITPAINPEDGTRFSSDFSVPNATTGVIGMVPAIRHGEISLDLASTALGVDLDDAKIQSFTLSFDLNREPQEKLSSKFAFAREIQFPVDVVLSVEANVGDFAVGDLSEIFCNDTEYDLGVTLNKPGCPGVGPVAARFDLKGAKLDSQNFNQTIGPNKTVSLQWTASLGGPQDLVHNLFVSGVLA